MNMKLTIKFSDEEREGLLEFQELLNRTEDVQKNPKLYLSIEQVVKQATFWAINESYRRGYEAVEMNRSTAGKYNKEQKNGESSEGIDPGDQAAASPSSDANSNALADTQKS